jgi:PHD/YefM family antitoxin component YafN of YafNO toxin-antitoxin module
MSALPTVRPISDVRTRQAEILEKIEEGPVILANRGHAAAVLLSLDAYNALIARLEDAEDAQTP